MKLSMMKIKYILFLFSFYFCLPAQSEVSYSRELTEIFSKLDNMILQREVYWLKKEERIKMLRNRIDIRASLEERFHTNKVLYEEYYVYNADSAMAYVTENLRIASLLKRKDWEYTWKINKSFLLSATGLLKEAEDEMRGIPVHELSDNAKVDYYSQMQYLLSHFSQYTGSESEEVQRSYLDKELLYRDSVYMAARPDHPLYLWYKGCKLQFDGVDSMRAVIPELQKAIQFSSLENRYDAMNAYILGSIYRDLNDMENYMKYLAYSSMADIVSCNKDIASLEELGIYLFSLGDIDRAYAYTNYCLQNALFYKNRVRIMGISSTIDQINAVYQERMRQQGERVQSYLFAVSILSAVLILAILYIYQKLRQLAMSRSKLHEMNEELNRHVDNLSEAQRQLKEVNEKLHSLNVELKDVNAQLRESNYVKEEYIGYVFSLCSNYISKLDEYRKNISRKIKTNQIDAVKAMTDRPTIAQSELKEFYKNFDAIFLHVYPSFVSDFNALLHPEEQIVLKEGELLNTELRIYALVRLGINDSVKIADFLHCSPQTVYNNRLKVRNKAIIPKEQFAETVRLLGKMKE